MRIFLILACIFLVPVFGLKSFVESEYVYFPRLYNIKNIQFDSFYKVLTSENNIVIDCAGHYYNVLSLEYVSESENKYLNFNELTNFSDLEESSIYQVASSGNTEDYNILIYSNGDYWNVIKLQHPFECPGCLKFIREYRN